MLSHVPSALPGTPRSLSSALHRRTSPGQQQLLCHHAAHSRLSLFICTLQKLLFEVSYFELKEKTEERYYRFREDLLTQNEDSGR